MKYIFLLSGDFLDIAREEILSLLNVKNFRVIGNVFIANLGNDEKEISKTFQRLALAKSIYKFLFKCKASEIGRLMQNFDWNSVYKGSFCLRMNYLDGNHKVSLTKKHIRLNSLKESNMKGRIKKDSEKHLAGFIWRALKKPKVDLDDPKTKIELFFINNEVYCGLLVHENKEDFESRKTHLRPFPNPSSLHPKIARALVNLAGIKEDEKVLDPFCGTGGFLIETGLMGINCIGYDISKNMVKGCIQNLKYFKIKKYRIINKNALRITDKIGYIVTDFPYGLNSNVYLQHNKKSINETSKNQGFLESRKSKRFSWKSNKINLKTNKKGAIKHLEKFYFRFLNNLRKILKKKAVIIFPSYVDYKKLLKFSKFKLEKEFSIYVHRSLTRNIVRIR